MNIGIEQKTVCANEFGPLKRRMNVLSENVGQLEIEFPFRVDSVVVGTLVIAGDVGIRLVFYYKIILCEGCWSFFNSYRRCCQIFKI